MKIIYIDSKNKCHITNDGTMIAIETNFFNGKCDTYIEGFCYEIHEDSTAIYPWKSYAELDTIQREYEKQIIDEHNQVLQELGVEI